MTATSGQGSLFPTEHWEGKGAQLRRLLAAAISENGLSYGFLADQTGVDERQIARCLKDDGGAHPPLALLACVMAHDHAGALITGLAEFVGYEATPKVPDLGAENRALREKLAEVRAEIDKVLGGRL